MNIFCRRAYVMRLRVCSHGNRSVFNITGSLDPEVTPQVKKEIETYWRYRINDEVVADEEKQKFYVLSMFPYPSGRLHMGHVRVYTISDALARFQRMRGKQVIHPIGWDAFGLPAENAAIDKNIHPTQWTMNNIATMRQQLKDLNISFDWSRELATCDPSYYKWTQHLFLLLYSKGHVYKKQASVNWDPVDQTVLADEQVDENGCSWRSGAKVEKRHLSQWFIRTTAFAKALYDGLNDPSLVEWRDVTKIQQFWIGPCSGFTFCLKVVHSGQLLEDSMTVWTDIPQFLFGATFVAVSHDNHFNTQEYGGSKEKIDNLLQIQVVHPLTGSLLPVYVTDALDHSAATDSCLGIPDEMSENCLHFAKKHNLEIINVVDRSSDTLLNSKQFTGTTTAEAKEKIVDEVRKQGISVYQTSSKLRDWLISRQRYWGTPIPIIYCSSCKAVPVPHDQLPVILPNLTELSGRGTSLKNATDWVSTKCPRCGGAASRETDTMDTFVDSSWYFLRYLDNNNASALFDTEKIGHLMPVDLYIGGKEHAYLHLLYARFMSHFCHSVGLLKHPEPFQQLLMQGMILGESYRVEETGKYVQKEEVDFSGKVPVHKSSGNAIIVEWEKMSKSKLNGVDPETVVKEHGIDTTRLFILGSVAPQSPRKWNAELFLGISKWQRRIWITLMDFINAKKSSDTFNHSVEDVKKYEADLYGSKNYHIKGATHNFMNTRQLSVAISFLQGLTTSLRRVPTTFAKESILYEETLASLIIMLAPLAPHFASELWVAFCSVASGSKDYDLNKSVLQQKWPYVDMDYNMRIIVKLNGDECDEIPIPRRELEVLCEKEAVQLALTSEKLKKKIENGIVKHIKFKPRPEFDAEVNVMYIPPKKNNAKPVKSEEQAYFDKLVRESIYFKL